MNEKQNAISPTRAQDYPEWYQQVIQAAELAESSVVRGCMVIRPWGYGIWESIQRQLDQRIKATGHENAYFPLFIPLSFFEREAAHVDGFAKECAVVTHHRLEAKDGKLVPAGELEEPLVVRPTSETIIGESFSKWVQSYRDLPLLINQWANVVRWEMRTRLFLRTAEFLWQEGHTVHATAEDAMEETKKMLEVYREFVENILALPVICGTKPAHERFAGAEETFAVEAMMQDRKALQAGTSHFLGQNFAKASNIKFSALDGTLQYAYTTSWGVSTRLIGGLIMAHSDDDGLKLPPRVAPKQIVILPVIPKPELAATVLEECDRLAKELSALKFFDQSVVVHIDKRDKRGGEKNWEWVKRGIPLRIELGPKDIEKQSVVVYRRDQTPRDKQFVSRAELSAMVTRTLEEMQHGLFDTALKYQQQHTYTDIKDFNELKKFFTPKNADKPEIHGGFVKTKWCGDPKSVELLDDMKVTIRCIPLQQSGTVGRCILTGKEATMDIILAKNY